MQENGRQVRRIATDFTDITFEGQEGRTLLPSDKGSISIVLLLPVNPHSQLPPTPIQDNNSTIDLHMVYSYNIWSFL